MAEVGNIKIADEVVRIVAAKAAVEVEGVHKMSGGVADEVNKIFGKKNQAKGVKVEVGEKECTVEAYIVVEYGVSIPEVASAVQQNVIRAITTMTGLNVVEVNVIVQDIYIPKEAQTENEETYMNEEIK